MAPGVCACAQVELGEGEETVELKVAMAGILSTEALLQASFDVCAEAVGMQLEGSDSKKLVLRYVRRPGRALNQRGRTSLRYSSPSR